VLEDKEQKVESVERALTILEAFSDGAAQLSLSELAKRTGLYRSTILRLVASLSRFGYIVRDEDGQFRLGPSLLRLGILYQNAFSLADLVRPVLLRLVERTDETAAFYIREGNRRICLYRHHSTRFLRHHLEEGAELPLDRGASGRVLMAFSGERGIGYQRIRTAGYYVSLGERDPETAAVAAPVFGVNERLVGAVGVTGHKSHFDRKTTEEFAAILCREAAELSHRLGSKQAGQIRVSAR
jgi:DNA-binding IclR family transcriptional regulator